MDLKVKLEEGKKVLISQLKTFPKILITLGSGLNSVLDEIEIETEIPYSEIPHCHTSKVQGHRGKLVVGKLAGVRVACMQGRTHYYELFNIHDVVFPFRLFAWAGAEKFILTNAAGSLDRKFAPGELVLIKDHINLMGVNPLLGVNHDFLGTRFPGLSNLYQHSLTQCFRDAAKETKYPLHEGVYAALMGPSFETPAENHMHKMIGADLVGMSTVPEAIALHHMGKQVSALSYVSNLAAGVTSDEPNHEEVLENASKVSAKFSKLVKTVLPLISL